MSVENVTASSGPYTADGATTVFPFTFIAASDEEVGVSIDGVVQTAGFTVAVQPDGTGAVTFAVAPVSGSVDIFSNPYFTQEVSFQRFGPYFPDTINAPLDRAAKRDIYLLGRINRLFPNFGTSLAALAGKFLSWDGSGNPITASGTGADSALRTDLANPLAGALLLAWKTTGAGAVLRTLYARLLDLPYSARDFGLKGDGTTEIAANLPAAIAAAAGRVLHIPVGTYAYDIALDLTGATDVNIDCAPGVVFDFTATASAGEALTFGGNLGASVALAADVVKGATVITLAAGHGLAAGHHGRLTSTVLWNPIRPEYIKGEQFIVQSVAGNNITLTAPLADGYTAATTTMRRYISGKLKIAGEMRVKRSGITAGVMVRYTRDAEVTGLKVEGAQERCLSFTENYNLLATRCSGRAAYAAGPETNYGFCSLSNAQARFIDCEGYGGRHGLTTGGTFPDRDLLFVRFDGDCDGGEGQSSMDTHSNGDRITFTDCRARNGAHFAAKNIIIRGGIWVSRTLSKGAIIWEFDAPTSGQFICEPDYVENKAGLVGIWVRGGIDGAGADFIKLKPNKIRTGNPSVVDAAALITLQAKTVGWTCIVPRTEIECGDVIIEGAAAASVYGLAVGAQSDWRGDVLLVGRFGEAIENVRGAYLKTTGEITSRDSRFLGSDTSNNLVDHEGGDWISENDEFNGGVSAVARCVSSTSTGAIHLFNPKFINLASNGGFENTGSTNIIISNAKQVGCSGNFLASSTHIRKSVGPSDISELMVTAAPTHTHFGNGSVAQKFPPTSGAAWEWVLIAGAWVAARNAP